MVTLNESTSMKTRIMLFCALWVPCLIFAQETRANKRTDQLLLGETTAAAASVIEIPTDPKGDEHIVWRLYPTEYTWVFLKLNTRNGMIFQLQYGFDGRNRKGSVLNARMLAEGQDQVNGRFTLYPTRNMWTFILLDQIDGRAYLVQWSQKVSDRFITPIAGIPCLQDPAE